MIAKYFGFDELIVCDSWKNTANRGATASYSRIWGDHMLIFRRSQTLNVREAVLGYTLEFEPFQVTRWEDLERGTKGGECIKPGWTSVPKVVAADAGYLIYDVVS